MNFNLYKSNDHDRSGYQVDLAEQEAWSSICFLRLDKRVEGQWYQHISDRISKIEDQDDLESIKALLLEELVFESQVDLVHSFSLVSKFLIRKSQVEDQAMW